MSDWQPIETAPWPKELFQEICVLVATDRGNVGPVKLHPNGWGYGFQGTPLAAIPAAGTIAQVGGESPYYSIPKEWERMTHWMPLPDPPTTNE